MKTPKSGISRLFEPVPWSVLARIEELVAEEEMPSDLRSLANSHRISFVSSDRNDPVVRRAKGGLGTIELSPAAQFAGPPAKLIRIPRLNRAAASKLRSHTDSHRPLWQRSRTMPSPAVLPEGTLMRTLDGRLLAPAHTGIFGPDNRAIYLPYAFPWCCVGTVEVVAQIASGTMFTSGSGVLVGPRHVLTASHLIPWSSTSFTIRFTPAFYQTGSLLGAGVWSWVTEGIAWQALDNVSAFDMALMRLDMPLGNVAGWWGSMAYQDAWNDEPWWQLLGYPTIVGGGDVPAAQAQIAVLETDSDGDAMELKHHGDATPGNSGGPLMGFFRTVSPPGSPLSTDYHPRVVGVCSGSTWKDLGLIDYAEFNVAAGGRSLVNLINIALARWP